MASRKIPVDSQVYELLKAFRRKGESFSQAIMRLFPPVNKPVVRPPVDYKKWVESIEPLSDEALDAVEQVVAQRRAPQNVTRPWKRKQTR
jgi:hypothetical protein